DVTAAAASALERSADLLAAPQGSRDALHAALDDLEAKLKTLERGVMVAAPAGQGSEGITALDPSFRARELSFVVSQIARNVDVAAAAEQRTWPEQLLGRQPKGIAGTLYAAQERAGAHVDPRSVWLQNSVRGAVGLAIAVLIANLSGVQHAFWVV